MGIFRNINALKEKGEGRKRRRRGHFLLTLLARRPIITPPLSGSGRPLIDRWRDRWRAPGCVKDSCGVKMELPSSCEVPAFTLACFLKKELYRWTDVPTDSSSYHLFIAAQSPAVRKLSHVGGQLTTISHGVVVFDWRAWQLFLSLSFCHFLCITGGSSPPLPGAEGDVKNVMIHGALTSFAAVTVSSVGLWGRKKKPERGNRSQVLLFT